MAKVVECARDGVVTRGEDDDELLANVQRHVAEAHPDLVAKLARAAVLVIAKEA